MLLPRYYTMYVCKKVYSLQSTLWLCGQCWLLWVTLFCWKQRKIYNMLFFCIRFRNKLYLYVEWVRFLQIWIFLCRNFLFCRWTDVEEFCVEAGDWKRQCWEKNLLTCRRCIFSTVHSYLQTVINGRQIIMVIIWMAMFWFDQEIWIEWRWEGLRKVRYRKSGINLQ
jgi:hypothetical protein